MLMKIPVIIITKGRVKSQKTLELLRDISAPIYLCAPVEEVNELKSLYSDQINGIIEQESSLPHVVGARQSALNWARTKGFESCIICDDDILKVEAHPQYELTQHWFVEFLEEAMNYDMCSIRWNTGFNKLNKPTTGLNAFLCSVFVYYNLRTVAINYDQTCIVFEDVDFTLQAIFKGLKVGVFGKDLFNSNTS